MRLGMTYISPRKELKSAAVQALVGEYLKRAQRFESVALEGFRSETLSRPWLARRATRVPPRLVLLDVKGRQLSSPALAEFLGRERDGGTQEVLLGIGSADGWSTAALQQAHMLLSLGAMTLPHELALVFLAEQTYRALTILAGHPYHSGHE